MLALAALFAPVCHAEQTLFTSQPLYVGPSNVQYDEPHGQGGTLGAVLTYPTRFVTW